MKSQKSGFRLKGRSAGRLAGAMGLLLALCLVVGGALPAYAQPPPIPHAFYGDVSINGTLAAEGTAVASYVGGVPKESTTVDSQGKYSLLVSGTAGLTVTFHVGGALANETAIWASGAVDELNLTVLGYDLTVASSAGGAVTTPGEGTFTYIDGTAVDLLAEPYAGYRFVNWTGDTGAIDNVNAADTFITMNDNYDITANFELIPPVQYDLTVASTAGGAVSDPGEDTFTYDAATVVDLLAEPDAGYQFVNWTGNVGTVADVNAADTFITMNDNYDITANFELIPLPPAAQKLIGVDTGTTATGGSGVCSNVALQRFMATNTGSITEFKVMASASGHVKVAIYDDSSGQPNSRLAAVDSSTSVVAGWNTIPIASTAVTSGTYYWLAVISDSCNIYYHSSDPSATVRWKPSTYSSWTWPGSAGSGWNTQTGYTYFIAGWGTIVLPTAPATPTPLPPTKPVTFSWTASGGATKYQLQVNTSPGFGGGTSLFDSEVTATTQVVVVPIGTTCYWHVRAGNAGGWSAYSSTGTVLP